MKKIVVTGALGHIGSYLIRQIPSLFPDAQIHMIDNFRCQRYCSLFNLPGQGLYRFFEEDITTADLVKRFQGADAVFHLAAITNAAESFDVADEVEHINVFGTRRVAEACVKSGAPLIFLSSTSVYGKSDRLVDETCSLEGLEPQSPYAESKIKGEQILVKMGAKDGLRFIICRFGTIFGISPGMRFHTAVNKFCWLAVSHIPLTVWKTAWEQERPYLDLKDAWRAFEFILKRNLFDGSIYNIVTLNSTIKNIFEAIAEEVPEAAYEMVDSPIMNQLSYRVSNKKFCDLGFRFQGRLKDGIRETIALLQSSQNALHLELKDRA
jgi:UDP-glucose 4-epimerase